MYQAKFEKSLDVRKWLKEYTKKISELSPDPDNSLDNLVFKESELEAPDFLMHSSNGKTIIEVKNPVTSDPFSKFFRDASQNIDMMEFKNNLLEKDNPAHNYDEAVSQYVRLGSFPEGDKDKLRLQHKLKDELTVIVLRRVVPGRCSYCPL